MLCGCSGRRNSQLLPLLWLRSESLRREAPEKTAAYSQRVHWVIYEGWGGGNGLLKAKARPKERKEGRGRQLSLLFIR
jgi:hypothetical protein